MPCILGVYHLVLVKNKKGRVKPVEHQEKNTAENDDFQQLASNFQPFRSPGAGEEIQLAAHWAKRNWEESPAAEPCAKGKTWKGLETNLQ